MKIFYTVTISFHNFNEVDALVASFDAITTSSWDKAEASQRGWGEQLVTDGWTITGFNPKPSVLAPMFFEKNGINAHIVMSHRIDNEG